MLPLLLMISTCEAWGGTCVFWESSYLLQRNGAWVKVVIFFPGKNGGLFRRLKRANVVSEAFFFLGWNSWCLCYPWKCCHEGFFYWKKRLGKGATPQVIDDLAEICCWNGCSYDSKWVKVVPIWDCKDGRVRLPALTGPVFGWMSGTKSYLEHHHFESHTRNSNCGSLFCPFQEQNRYRPGSMENLLTLIVIEGSLEV